jgi:hypothetical protein
LYFTTLTTADANEVLERALDAFVSVTSDDQPSQVLYRLQYEQLAGADNFKAEGSIFTLPATSPSLSFGDSMLGPVREGWEKVMGAAAAEAEYMVFEDREGAMGDDDVYE